METKTYFASSLQAAMELARRELGPDAMLINSRPAPESARALGRLEVNFAWERPVAKATRREETGLEDIRLEISELRAAIGRAPQRPGAVAEINSDAVRLLCETGMGADTARQLASAGEGVLRELTARIPVASFAPVKPDESRTLAFVGPPGRGKTTSLVKVAVKYGLAAGVPTRIYLAGAHGVGSAEQMARYAAILGVPFQALESFDAVNLALQGDRWRGLVLIDTPGMGSGNRQEMEAMGKFFARRNDIERHLVLRADARSADMQYMVSQFTPVRPTRVLFTGIDEVTGLGSAADTMIRTGIPTVFFGTGPQIPDDLEEVDVPKLARALWAAKLTARAA